jgi:lauroyl/myristoyl acyltransferase
MRLASAKDLFHLSVVAVVVTAGRLPSAGAREGVARALGWAAHLLSREKRRRVEQNVERILGDVPGRRRVVRASFDDVWREMLAWTAPVSHEPARIVGRQHLERALADGRGAILWECSGFGRRLRAKQILHAAGFPVHQLHGVYHVGGLFSESSTRLHAALKRFFDDLERRFVAEVIYLPASESLAFTRGMHQRLQRNEILCVSADGREGQRLVPLRFLGRTTPFAPGMVSLAKLSGAPLLPIFCTGSDSLVIEAAIRVDPTAERERAVQQALGQYAALLETYVRRRPELYRSWHV